MYDNFVFSYLIRKVCEKTRIQRTHLAWIFSSVPNVHNPFAWTSVCGRFPPPGCLLGEKTIFQKKVLFNQTGAHRIYYYQKIGNFEIIEKTCWSSNRQSVSRTGKDWELLFPKRGHLSLYQFFLYTSEYERREEKLILFLDLSLTSVVKMIVTSLWFADRPIWKISHKRWLWCAISKPERTQKTIDGYFAYFMSPFDLRLLSLGIKNSQFACGGEQHLVCKATLPRRNFALKKYQIWTAKGHQIPKYSFPIDDYIFFCRCPASVLSAASKWRFSCDPTSFSCQSGLQIWIGGVYGRTHCWKFKLWLSFPCGWWWYNQSYKTA